MDEIHKIIFNYRQMKVHDLAEMVDIKKIRHRILPKDSVE